MFFRIGNSSITGAALLPTEAAVVGVSGNRLPYSFKHLLTAGMGYANRSFSPGAFNARLEAHCISDQFGDDRNLVAPMSNGRPGILSGRCMMNAESPRPACQQTRGFRRPAFSSLHPRQ